MPPTLAQESATARLQVLQQVATLHTAMSNPSNSPSAARRASARLSSSTSQSVSFSATSSSARERSWQFTPGISSIHPIHQLPSCLMTAR
jgi:hypothetical protein